jgi:RNA-binding protein
MKITAKHKKHLRRLGHQLSPVVRISQDGLKQTVIEATQEALKAHELIKVKALADNREEQSALVDALGKKTGATLISQTGFTALLFRRNIDSPKISFD